jgi:predicted ATPase
MPKPVCCNNLIQQLTPRNFLSFGPENVGIDLKPLNLLIGPNGSGKSNLIEAVSFMRAATREFDAITRKGGGVKEWIWKGDTEKAATVDWVVSYPDGALPLRHVVEFYNRGRRFTLADEWVGDSHGISGKKPVAYYRDFGMGEAVASYVLDESGDRRFAEAPTRGELSVLTQLSDPFRYPEFAWLSANYSKIRIYREWSFGRNAVFREPQPADVRNDILEEDFSNIGLFLSKLRKAPKAKKAIIENLKKLYDGLTDFDVVAEGGSVQVFFTEGDFVIPAARLSDGTLRFLCLLAILCDPEPPPLICIEEPELGLHPDILPTVADLLKSASERTQIIVTTHSDILVDAMTDRPESVVVCEKHEGKTEMTRLSASELAVWLEKYRLGQLWIQGQLGGTRW